MLSLEKAVERKSKIAAFRVWLAKNGLDEKDHQISGMKFCVEHEITDTPSNGVRGAIIADEMGLGKTILMMGLNAVNPDKRTLIVLPPALMEQWLNIIRNFAGVEPFVYHGVKAKALSVEEIAEKQLVVTTYGMIAQRKKGTSKLWKVKWDRLICDEAHHLRNNKTGQFLGAKQLKADIKWLVTGTPIQNSHGDFVSLCNILGLRLKQISKMNPELSSEDLAIRIIKMHVLRRTKKKVGIQLPAMKEEVIKVEWESKEEKLLAAEIHANTHFSNVSVDNVLRVIDHLSQHPLPMLMRAKQTCILPALLEEAILKMKMAGNIPNHINLTRIPTSSKTNAVVSKIIERADNGRKKLVFSHFRKEIDQLESDLSQAGLRVGKVDGRSSKNYRKEAITSPIYDVLIVQIQTACEGLNMQHFQEVYFTSPHWNPAVEDQAIARCHRIGQTEEVEVFRFAMSGFDDDSMTIDEYCMLIQEKKRELQRMLDQ